MCIFCELHNKSTLSKDKLCVFLDCLHFTTVNGDNTLGSGFKIMIEVHILLFKIWHAVGPVHMVIINCKGKLGEI